MSWNFSHALGIPLNVPLEAAIMGHMTTPSCDPITSPPVDNDHNKQITTASPHFENDSKEHITTTPVDRITSPSFGKTLAILKQKPDVTEIMFGTLVRKCTVYPMDGTKPYFG